MRSAATLPGALLIVGACAGTLSAAAPPATQDAEGGEAARRAAPELISLLGTPLHRPELPAARRDRLETDLREARARWERDPADEGAIVWYGRRLAYLSRYREAIDVYTEGLAIHPDSYRLRRHRGHRYITARRFAAAVDELSRAAELMPAEPLETEPDGIPNALGVPLSSTQFNVWYHLGLAHYLRGDYEAALSAYRRCMATSDNDDLRVATGDWTWMTLRRLGRDREAEELLESIDADMEIVENDAYHRRLLMYKGEVDPGELLDLRAADDPDRALQIATQGYGVGNWHLVNGDVERAREVFERILEGSSWAAFGYIAAESDLRRWERVSALAR